MTALPPENADLVLSSDESLIDFAHKHDESLDWLICGVAHRRRHRQNPVTAR
jgi:hypothetical protein